MVRDIIPWSKQRRDKISKSKLAADVRDGDEPKRKKRASRAKKHFGIEIVYDWKLFANDKHMRTCLTWYLTERDRDQAFDVLRRNGPWRKVENIQKVDR